MKRLKKIAASSAVTIAALALAIGLLGYSTIGGARAALTYYSDDYISRLQLLEIGVTLYENGAPVATGADHQTNTVEDNTNNAGEKKGLLSTLLLKKGNELVKVGEKDFHLGVHYTEQLSVHNPEPTDTNDQQKITQYVRVTITRYWTGPADADGKEGPKLASLNPSYIQLLLNGTDISSDKGEEVLAAEGWLVDSGSTTPERLVLYYTQPVAPGEYTTLFADTFSIDPQAGSDMISEKKDEGDGTLVTRTWLYDNANFHLDVRVDAVQDHHAEQAIRSAWGRSVTIDQDGNITAIIQ